MDITDDLKPWDKPKIIRWLKNEPCELYKQDLRKYYYLSRESLYGYEDYNAALNENEKAFLSTILKASVAQQEKYVSDIESMIPDSQERIIDALLRKFKLNEDVKFSLISLLFVRFTNYQSEICDIIKTKDSAFFVISKTTLLGKMHKTNPTIIEEMLSYLKSNNTIKEEYVNLIIAKDNSVAVKAVPRG